MLSTYMNCDISFCTERIGTDLDHETMGFASWSMEKKLDRDHGKFFMLIVKIFTI